MAEYTVLVSVAVAVAVGVDLRLLRTGLLGRRSFWVSLAIMWFFQVFVDGWLTKLTAPLVIYDDDSFSGRRIFFDSPVEDFAFGFALILATLSVWTALGRRRLDP